MHSTARYRAGHTRQRTITSAGVPPRPATHRSLDNLYFFVVMAGRGVVLMRGRKQVGHDVDALSLLLLGEGRELLATGPEAAPGGRVRRARQVPGEQDASARPLLVRVGEWDRRQQRLGVGVHRVVVDLVHLAE